MKGVKEGSIRGTYTKYTDQELIDVVEQYDTIKDLRAGEDLHFYFLAKRRGLGHYLPARRTKDMNLVGSSLERTITLKEQRAIERQEIKNLKEQEKFDKKEAKRRGAYNVKSGDTTIASKMYREVEVDGVKICGRCLEHDLGLGHSKMNKNICQPCYAKYLYLRQHNRDSNPHNIKDEYCHIKITHHEKIFQIGIKADKKLEDYLTMIGYGFIFKECSK